MTGIYPLLGPLQACLPVLTLQIPGSFLEKQHEHNGQHDFAARFKGLWLR